MKTQEWTVSITLDEDVDTTHAHAVLTRNDGGTIRAEGTAHRNPVDAPVPEIGEELAAARALAHLADSLTDVVDRDLQTLSHPAGS